MRAACLLAISLSACWLEPWPRADMIDPSVGFLYRGTVEDHVWTRAHDDGRRYLEEHFPSVTTHFETDVGVEDAPGVLDDFVAAGDSVIIATSPDLLAATQDAATGEPQVNFLAYGAFVSSDNLGGYAGRMYQAWYLAGMVAGHVTAQSGADHIGVVATMATPEAVRQLNALALGAQAENPEVSIRVEWLEAWSDSQVEPQLVDELVGAGADVIVSMSDSSAALDAVQQLSDQGLPVWSIGYGSGDTCALIGPSCLTAPYWNWGPYYAELLDQMMRFRWHPELSDWEQMTEDRDESVLHLAEISEEVSAEYRLEVEEQQARLAKPGYARRPFVGPLVDAQGTLRVADGEAMADADLQRMCWFVEGIADADGLAADVPDGCDGDR